MLGRCEYLKVLSGPPAHKSQATLFKSRKADWSGDNRPLLAALLKQLQIDE